MCALTVNNAILDCHSETFLSDCLSICFISLIASIICCCTIADFSSYTCFISSSSFSNSSSCITFPSTIGIMYIPFCADFTWNPCFCEFSFSFVKTTSRFSSNSFLINAFSFSKSSALNVFLISFFTSFINPSIFSLNSLPCPAGSDTAIGSFGFLKLYI